MENLLGKKVYIVGGDFLIEKMYRDAGLELVDELDKAELVQFTGGHDVTPSLYGDVPHPTTSNDEARDRFEKVTYKACRPDQIKVGICRGAQFLCAMNGGTLWQDVNHHAIRGTHEILVLPWGNSADGPTLAEVTSTHHQMMRPSKHNSNVIGIAHLSTYRDTGLDSRKVTRFDREGPDVEIVLWRDSRSFGFQGHPEYESVKCRELFLSLLDKYVGSFKNKVPKIIVDEEEDAEFLPDDED